MTRTTLALSALILALVTPNLPADEVRLKDGRVLVGSVRKLKSHLEVKTLDGVVRVRLEEVERIRDEKQLEDELSLLAMRSGAGSAHAQLELARVARKWGIYAQMWRFLGAALRSSQSNASVQKRAREFMASLEKEVLPKKWRSSSSDIKVRELLFRLRSRPTRAKVAVIEELLVHEPQIDKHLRQRARRDTSPLNRITSVRALARRPQEGNDRFVYRTAILDGNSQVRKEAMQASRAAERSTDAVAYLAPGLLHANAKFRIRTAQAYGILEDESAVPLLVDAGPLAATAVRKGGTLGGSTRAHMAVINQVSYIRDFDVEVAQASFIADPKIDVLQSGVVLDVTVVSVQTHRIEILRVYRRALKDITGDDPGPDPKKWREWEEKREKEKSATPKTPTAPKTGEAAKKKDG